MAAASATQLAGCLRPFLDPWGLHAPEEGSRESTEQREQGAGAVPGNQECLRRGPARAGGGGDSKELSAPEVLRREKVETGAQGGADTEELSVPGWC